MNIVIGLIVGISAGIWLLFFMFEIWSLAGSRRESRRIADEEVELRGLFDSSSGGDSRLSSG